MVLCLKFAKKGAAYKPVNIYDIANEAGVSITTVSRVLNGKRNVNPDTRRRVEAVLAKHNYVPSAIARGLVSNSMRTVAVLVVDVRIPNYARAAHVIENECAHRGYNVIMCNTGTVQSDTMRYLEILSRRQVDGFVLIGSVYNELLQSPKLSNVVGNIPCVTANGKLDLPNTYSVLVDDHAGVAQAAEHLVQKGHRRIAFLQDNDNDSARRKLSGYQSVMQRHGLEPLVLECESSLEGGMEAAEHFWANHSDWTALVCAEDITAAGVVKALHRKGVSVPQQVAVTGYNASLYSRICEPSLTTVDNRPEMMGLMAVQLLASMMDGRTESCASITLQPALVVGQST